MPLLISPIDGSPMHQIKRFGIELDVCPTSGGVWLDKGELEKIMALIREETSAPETVFRDDHAHRDDRSRDTAYRGGGYEHDRHRPSGDYRRRDDDDDDDYRRGGDRRKRSRLLDLFDFD